ncbi:conserved hypothetical protein [Hyphomicrobiales bacterium]|nr:conserved hypothetical protein [Hyphomicrobiales bacterium]CAH1700639.1 conserved hypothetical protein [Hyphomicrobiales bacterium]CAI0344487.1 conserved hypothetical protein [Hyphomicrobiales bacterium]
MRKTLLSLPAGLFMVAVVYAVSSFVLPSTASAVVCAKGVYRAGCVGPNGAAVARRGYVAPRSHGAVCRRYGVVGGVRRCVAW